MILTQPFDLCICAALYARNHFRARRLLSLDPIEGDSQRNKRPARRLLAERFGGWQLFAFGFARRNFGRNKRDRLTIVSPQLLERPSVYAVANGLRGNAQAFRRFLYRQPLPCFVHGKPRNFAK